MSARRLDASALRDWAHTAVGDLISHTDEINRLNVFPVADADTGTNMLFTMRSAWAQADTNSDSDDVTQVAAALAAGALHGARGNSGVILSQILRGLADVVSSAAMERGGALADIDGPVFAAALRHAVGLVVASMGEPVPGTIVSVLQDAAGAAEHAAADLADLAEVVSAAADAAAVALDKTTGQLDVLAEAGVVDAGGRGLLVLLDAMSTTLTGRAPHRHEYLPSPPTHRRRRDHRRCAAVRGDVPAERLRRPRRGDAPRALGPAGRIGGHRGVGGRSGPLLGARPCRRCGRCRGGGLVGRHAEQDPGHLPFGRRGARPAGGWSRERAVLAVVDGDGAAELFAGEGAHVLRPEADAPVSAKQLLHALVNTGAAQIMVLPNGYVAAEELVAGCTAAIGWGIDVVPVPAGSMVQGLAALAVHDAERQAVDDGYTMARAAAGARTGSVRVATEEALTWAGTCRPGDGLAIAGDEVLIVGNDIIAAAAGLIDLLLAAGGELVTVLTGAGVDGTVGDALQQHVHTQHLGAELVTYHTDHRGDALLIGVE